MRSPIKLDQSIKSIALGELQALMIDIDDNVYEINDLGEDLGAVDKKDRPSWTRVSKLEGRAIKVQCGYSSSAILTTAGLYTMGNDNFGGATPQLVTLPSVIVDNLSIFQ